MFLVNDATTLPTVSVELIARGQGLFKIVAKKRIPKKANDIGKTIYTITRDVKDLQDYVRVSKLLLRLDDEFWQIDD